MYGLVITLFTGNITSTSKMSSWGLVSFGAKSTGLECEVFGLVDVQGCQRRTCKEAESKEPVVQERKAYNQKNNLSPRHVPSEVARHMSYCQCFSNKPKGHGSYARTVVGDHNVTPRVKSHAHPSLVRQYYP